MLCFLLFVFGDSECTTLSFGANVEPELDRQTRVIGTPNSGLHKIKLRTLESRLSL